MTFTGRFRIFFNVHNEAPRVWCIRGENNGWEIAVCQFVICTDTPVISRYQRHTVGKHDLYEPSAWFEAEGKVSVGSDGIATITSL